MTFRVGQNVVCIKASTISGWGGKQDAEVGRVYTIRCCYIDEIGTPGLLLEEIKNPVKWSVALEFGFVASRFRPVVDRKTDISFAHEILRKATKPARSPAVSLHQGN